MTIRCQAFVRSDKGAFVSGIVSDLYNEGQQRLSLLLRRVEDFCKGDGDGTFRLEDSCSEVGQECQSSKHEDTSKVDPREENSVSSVQNGLVLGRIDGDQMEVELFDEPRLPERHPEQRAQGLPPVGEVSLFSDPDNFLSFVSAERRTPPIHPPTHRETMSHSEEGSCACCLLPVEFFNHAFYMPCCGARTHLSCIDRVIGLLLQSDLSLSPATSPSFHRSKGARAGGFLTTSCVARVAVHSKAMSKVPRSIQCRTAHCCEPPAQILQAGCQASMSIDTVKLYI